MSSIERIRFRDLPESERVEIDSLLREKGARFLSDLADTAAWWILVLVMGTLGVVALLVEGMLDERLVPYVSGLHAFIALLAVMTWVAVTWIRNHGRRGYLATSFATIRIKGPKLVLMRHARVIDGAKESHGRPGRRFTTLKLEADDGKTWSLNVHGGWADAAIAAIKATKTPGPAS